MCCSVGAVAVVDSMAKDAARMNESRHAPSPAALGSKDNACCRSAVARSTPACNLHQHSPQVRATSKAQQTGSYDQQGQCSNIHAQLNDTKKWVITGSNEHLEALNPG